MQQSREEGKLQKSIAIDAPKGAQLQCGAAPMMQWVAQPDANAISELQLLAPAPLGIRTDTRWEFRIRGTSTISNQKSTKVCNMITIFLLKAWISWCGNTNEPLRRSMLYPIERYDMISHFWANTKDRRQAHRHGPFLPSAKQVRRQNRK